jgi:hypothetical protein
MDLAYGMSGIIPRAASATSWVPNDVAYMPHLPLRVLFHGCPVVMNLSYAGTQASMPVTAPVSGPKTRKAVSSAAYSLHRRASDHRSSPPGQTSTATNCGGVSDKYRDVALSPELDSISTLVRRSP